MAHLEGELIRLRAPEPEDAAALNPAFSDPDVLANLEFRFPQPVKGFEEFLDFVRTQDGHHLYAIERLAEGDAIGMCDLRGVSLHLAPEFGIWIAKPYWNRGYGTDAVRTAARHAFRDLGVHRLTLSVHEDNPRGRRAYEKAGFVDEGTMREAIFAGGRWADVHIMGLLASAFED